MPYYDELEGFLMGDKDIPVNKKYIIQNRIRSSEHKTNLVPVF
jgi:hypothetical protein